MSLLLAKKDILLINTKLAMIIGLNDAVVLQQLSYWLEETNSGVEHDGMRWIYNTHEQWQEQFPFWSVDTVKRSFASLLKRDLIFVKQLSAATRNQTNYYTINRAAVDALHQGNLPSSINANCPDGAVQVAPIQKGKMPRSSNKTETTTETTAETLSATPSAPPPGAALVVPVKQKKPKAVPAGETELQAACRATWGAYAQAYAAQYGAAPVRNAKVNSAVKAFVQRLGHDESPAVAAFFVERVSDALVVRGMHDFGLLLARAETFRTQWVTGQSMTATRARQIDQSQANFSAADEAIALMRARRSNQGVTNA